MGRGCKNERSGSEKDMLPDKVQMGQIVDESSRWANRVREHCSLGSRGEEKSPPTR